MSGSFGVLIFVFSLLASIGLHEVGHMVPAKKFGVRVSQYMIGFGPTLWSRVRGETEYGLKAIPLGGYVRLIGMFGPGKKQQAELGQTDLAAASDGSDTDANDDLEDEESGSFFGSLIEGARQSSVREIRPGEEARALYNLSAPKKFIVMFGGPFMNFLIACVLFTIACVFVGTSVPTTGVAAVVACVPTADNPTGIESTDGTCADGVASAAHSADLKAGDKLLAVNGAQLTAWEDLANAVSSLADKSAVLKSERDGQLQSVTVILPAREIPVYDAAGADTGKTHMVGFVGVRPQFETQTNSIGSMPIFIWQQVKDTGSAILSFPKAAVTMAQTVFTSKPRAAEGPVSVIGIGQISGQIASDQGATTTDKTWAFLMMIASLNMFLFMFNLLPVLPLDGGHLAAAIYEGSRRQVARLRRKPLPGSVDTVRMMPVAYVMGVLLIGLSIISIVADLIKPIAF
ncbi:MAG: site-2 protease family protein [Actinobacteria bacterium]|nr:site-2 protease family protein [Actinomycetota bacterium]